jgi:mercuric ion binding protein
MYIGSKYFFTGLLLVGGCHLWNQQKTAEFYVRANCEMCEDRIEAAVSDLEGVESADFNLENHQLTVSFDPDKISELEIHQAVANVGHGTKLVPVNISVHEKLPSCCKEVD